MKYLGDGYYNEKELLALGVREVGEQVRVHKRASLYGLENICLGSYVRIDDFCVIVATGSLNIGSFVHIPPFCFLGARYGISIGNFCSFAHGVRVYSSADDYSGEWLSGPMVGSELVLGGERVSIGDHCILGANSIILPGVVLEEGVALGALSLVKENLRAFGVYAGIPARYIKKRSKAMLSQIKNIKLNTSVIKRMDSCNN